MIDLCHHSSIYLPRSQKNVARQNVIWLNVGFPVSAEGARLSGGSRCSGLLRLREERGPGGKLPALTKLRRLKNLRSTQKLSTPPFRLKTFFSEELFCKKREDWKKIHRPRKLDSAAGKKKIPEVELCVGWTICLQVAASRFRPVSFPETSSPSFFGPLVRFTAWPRTNSDFFVIFVSSPTNGWTRFSSNWLFFVRPASKSVNNANRR